MDEAALLKAIDFPKSTHVLRTFPFNKIEPRLNPKQKALLSEQIISRSIKIVAVIQTDNTNIESFEDEKERYTSIQFFSMQIKQLSKAKEIYKVFAALMPYPLVILFSDNVHTRWIFAMHEKKKDGFYKVKDIYEISECVSIEDVQEKLTFTALSHHNLKRFYQTWLEQLLSYDLSNTYNVERSVTLENNTLAQLKVLEKEIKYHVDLAKKESQLNKKIEYQLAANELKQKKQVLLTE